MIALFLEHGADLRLVDDRDHTPFTSLFNLDCYDAIEIVRKFETLVELKEWRPWNHDRYPTSYRHTLKAVLLLAKTYRVIPKYVL